MKSNAEIIREALERIVNQKRIDAWDEYFSPKYVARGAPSIGLGLFIDGAGDKHIVSAITPDSPVDGKLQVGDQLAWIEDEHQRWSTYDDISQGLHQCRGGEIKVCVRRGEQTLEFDLARGLIPGFDTDNERAKAEMRDFMTRSIPDLRVEIKMTLAEGDVVACLMEYRGTHAVFQREAVWREAWFARLSEGRIVESWPLPDIDAYCRQLGYQMTPPSA